MPNNIKRSSASKLSNYVEFFDELGTKFDDLKSVIDKYNNEAISFGYSEKEGWFISLDLDDLKSV